ncbi:hypothetical protein [Haloterrigena salinisoli]|uniref:hypothetical protein n=1 Tax=Haloterrigena salinisoli TaxID=3132747 RepID=UPI0030CD8BFD
MADSQESEESVSFDQLGDHRRSILETVRGLGGEANAAEIRQRTDVPEGSFGWHFGKLEEWSLLEDVGRQNVGGGDDAIVWSLTDAGADLLERIDVEEGREDRPQTFEGLNNRIDELETDLEAIKTEFNRMADIVEDHHDRLESL